MLRQTVTPATAIFLFQMAEKLSFQMRYKMYNQFILISSLLPEDDDFRSLDLGPENFSLQNLDV